MESIWVAAEMRAGSAYAHSTLALHALAAEESADSPTASRGLRSAILLTECRGAIPSTSFISGWRESLSRRNSRQEHHVSTSAKWDHQTLALEVNDASSELDTLVSHGRKPPVLFLHGFGSTKEDYADFAHIPNLAAGGFIAFDAPGFGRSMSSDLSRVS